MGGEEGQDRDQGNFSVLGQDPGVKAPSLNLGGKGLATLVCHQVQQGCLQALVVKRREAVHVTGKIIQAVQRLLLTEGEVNQRRKALLEKEKVDQKVGKVGRAARKDIHTLKVTQNIKNLKNTQERDLGQDLDQGEGDKAECFQSLHAFEKF